jgi:hypothetical protein
MGGQAVSARWRRAAAVVPLLLVAAALSFPLPALAADVTFGDPQATATYDKSIEFTVDVNAGVPIERVELRLRFPDSLGPVIIDVSPPRGTGPATLHYSSDLTGDGHIVPNTPIEATWAAFTSAGGEPVTSRTETFRYADTAHEWKSVKGDLMTVHWYQGGQAFAEKALKIGEQAIRDTSKLLGVTESKPVDFFIYGDEASFRDALGPGTRENVGGQAHSDIRTLFALIGPNEIDDPWVGIVVPHELTHLVFDTAVRNPYRFPPRWLNEGLAVYLSQGFTSDDRQLVRQAADGDSLLPLVALGGQFPTDPQRTYLAYAEAVSAIDYLVRTDGQDTLISLVKAYADGLTDDEAFTRATGDDLAAFEAGWLADLGAKTPQQYGPKPAPAGPLPPGWSGPGPASAPGPTPAAASPVAPAAAATPGIGAPVATAAPAAPAPSTADAASAWMPVVVLLALGVVVMAVVLVLLRRRDRGASA